MNFKISLLCLFFSFIHFTIEAQISSDSIKLPFSIALEKKLCTEDIANKKEGVYLTGIPDISSDPVNGIGFGAEGSIFFNGKKNDPFFCFTPYRAAANLAIFYTTKSQREIKLDFDIPYVFNSKWRLRGELAYEVNPNNLYFGVNTKSLQGLSYYPGNDSSKTLVNNASYNDYENALTGNSADFNTYQKQEAIINLSAEHSYFDGRIRALIGIEAASINITTPLNKYALLQQDARSNKVLGYGKNLITFLQVGLIYDTRDLEPDPSSGSFAELTNELSLQALGSQFNFNKIFVHYNYYHRIFPSVLKKWVFAGRIGLGYTSGDAPFYEYQDQWSSEGSIEGLGGGHTMRGFKQSRFLGRVMEFTILELRCRLWQFKALQQNLAFSLVPFVDAGGVWDDFNKLNFNNFRYSEGLGLRIAWNTNTILRFDYAVSKEDHQFFFELNHAF